jgi:hypothetical protein
MTHPTCWTCAHRVALRGENPGTCAKDGRPARAGQTCGHVVDGVPAWAPRRLPFTDRLRRETTRKMEVELL